MYLFQFVLFLHQFSYRKMDFIPIKNIEFIMEEINQNMVANMFDDLKAKIILKTKKGYLPNCVPQKYVGFI